MSAHYQRILEVMADVSGVSVREFEQRQIDLSPHTPNGRAVAAIIFYRAGDYWPGFFDLADQSALAAWAQMFDEYQPFVTPAIAERAVDAVAASVAEPAICDFLQAAAKILQEGTDA